MIGLFCFVLAALTSPFKSKLRLEAENAGMKKRRGQQQLEPTEIQRFGSSDDAVMVAFDDHHAVPCCAFAIIRTGLSQACGSVRSAP